MNAKKEPITKCLKCKLWGELCTCVTDNFENSDRCIKNVGGYHFYCEGDGLFNFCRCGAKEPWD